MAKQINKRSFEELAAEDNEQLKRKKHVTTADVKTAQSDSVEFKALDEINVQNGGSAADKDGTPSADELDERKKPTRKAKAKAKATPKKKAAPSRRGPPACPECKRRKVCHGSKLCLPSPHLPFHRYNANTTRSNELL